MLPLASAQSQASAVLAKKSIVIGEQVAFKIQLSATVSDKIEWPVIKDTLSADIEIIKVSAIDTLTNKNQVTYSQSIIITAFNAGTFIIPSITYNVLSKQGKQTSSTKPLLLQVTTVSVDTEKPIRDILSPFPVPFTFKEVLPFLLLIILLAIVIVVLYKYIKYRKLRVPLLNIGNEILIPAHEEALEALEKLRLEKLWQQNKFKEYYTQLTDILRVYLERRYGISAQEMTSDEIIDAMRNQVGLSVRISEMEELLRTADLVKFAKEQPLADTNQKMFETIYVFVKQTAVYVHLTQEKGGADDTV